jgi:hydroxyacylglutathione hydrolase
MNKGTVRILLPLGLLIGLLAVFPGMRIFRMLSDLKAMTPLETGEVIAGVYAIRDSYVNLYLIQGADGYVAIDSGVDPDVVRAEMKKTGADPARVSAVFLTHGDTDHTGGLAAFENAVIYLPAEEEQMVDERRSRFIIFKNRAIPNHRLLKDGQVVRVDDMDVAMILTPGHTPGAASYFVSGRYLFVGDSVCLKNGKADMFSKAMSMDSGAQLMSLRKLARLAGVKYLFTGHYGYTDSFDRAFEAFRP